MISKIIKGKFADKPVTLWGDGYQIRELIHVSEFIQTLLSVNLSVSNEIINIGSGQGCTIREFAEIICTYLSFDHQKIQYDISKYVGAKSKVLNIDKLNKILPKRKQISLKQGLDETIEWFYKEVYLKNNALEFSR